jgi:GH15 family glucan-1,4-alpha-glucosidase
MPLPIENYALIGDCHTAALVGSDGSIDWLCLPRFDSPACFAALLGGPEHGRWQLTPTAQIKCVRRRYRDLTLILETEFETAEGSARLIDFMPLSDERWDVVRIVEGVSGRIAVRMELIVRFDYGSIVPWVRRSGDMLLITAGPDTLELTASTAVTGENMRTVAEFTVGAGDRESFVLNYRPSHLAALAPIDGCQALADAEAAWHRWSERCKVQGPRRGVVLRSLVTLKALTYKPTGRRAQLGLSLLLAAGRHVHVECAAARRLCQGGDSLAGMAAARGGGLAARSADSVRRDGCAPPG